MGHLNPGKTGFSKNHGKRGGRREKRFLYLRDEGKRVIYKE